MAKKTIKNVKLKSTDGKEYVLEFSRTTACMLEERGVTPKALEGISEKPIGLICKLVHGAFLMHHPDITEDEAFDVYYGCKDKGKLIEEIAGLYQATIETLMGEGSGNVTVETIYR